MRRRTLSLVQAKVEPSAFAPITASCAIASDARHEIMDGHWHPHHRVSPFTLIVARSLMNDFNRKVEDASARVGKTINEAAERLEKEIPEFIKYLNDEVVPAVRTHSTKALRVASPSSPNSPTTWTSSSSRSDVSRGDARARLCPMPPGRVVSTLMILIVLLSMLFLASCGHPKAARVDVPPPPPPATTETVPRPEGNIPPTKAVPAKPEADADLAEPTLPPTPSPSLPRKDSPAGTDLPITTAADRMARSTTCTP